MSLDLHDSLEGQVALVTGANRGIGAALADGLVEFGATVYAGARSPAEVDDGDRRPVRIDVTDETTVTAALDRIVDEAGRLDVLVNNAGVYGPGAAVGGTDVDGLDRTLDTNLRGPFLCARAALSPLLERPGGRVVNVSSRAGQFADASGGDHAAYRISKAGLNALTVALDGAYGDRGLLANAYCPGWVRTDMGGPEADRSPAEGADTGLFLARLRPGGPGGGFWAERERIEW